jgi:hypothetical protein
LDNPIAQCKQAPTDSSILQNTDKQMKLRLQCKCQPLKIRVLEKVCLRSIYSSHGFLIDVYKLIQIVFFLIVQAGCAKSAEFINVTLVIVAILGSLRIQGQGQFYRNGPSDRGALAQASQQPSLRD